MITKEQAQVGAKVAIPSSKSTGNAYEHFEAELAGRELMWDSDTQDFVSVPRRGRRGDPRCKPYPLPYLVIASVRAFADSRALCIQLRRDDEVSWLGADLFMVKDLTLYTGAAPVRIQRRRNKGFDLQAQSPDGRPVVNVCRPGRWGNEFRVVREDGGFWVVDSDNNYWGEYYETHEQAVKKAIRLWGPWIEGKVEMHEHGCAGGLDIRELRGRHLACYCPLDAPCHADLLLRLASQADLVPFDYGQPVS